MTGPRVVLVGPMGSGKTTVGRLLAGRWQVAVRDTDEDIETVEGRSIGEIFVDDGEARFREIEREAVAKALSDHDGVLSLGGGAVLAEQTRELLARHPVVFLKVGLSDAVSRVGLGESRPLLNQAVGGIRSRIKQLLDERTPVYESVATITVDTSGRTPEDVATEIDTRLEETRA
jgi:shikimate kinase